MPFIRLQDIKSGMVPVEDIKDRTGRVILNAGTKISSHHIKTLKAWGITEVLISDDSKTEEDISIEEVEISAKGQLKKEMIRLFRFTDARHPFIKELFVSCLDRKSDS